MTEQRSGPVPCDICKKLPCVCDNDTVLWFGTLRTIETARKLRELDRPHRVEDDPRYRRDRDK